jgi:hypothetical protein
MDVLFAFFGIAFFFWMMILCFFGKILLDWERKRPPQSGSARRPVPSA